MFFEFLYRFLTFDVDWLVRLFLDPHSLFWIFLMAAVAWAFYGKHQFWWAIAYMFLFNWLFGGVSAVIGWPIVPALLGIVFIYNVIQLHFIENDSTFKKYRAQLALVVIIGAWYALTFVV